MPLKELDRWLDDAAAELQIWPSRAAAMQPAELFALKRGQQRLWNQQCLLTAWSTYITAAAFGGMKDISFDQFLERWPPPGYDPKT